jgi:hypothetical protein
MIIKTIVVCPECKKRIEFQKDMFPDEDGVEGWFPISCKNCPSVLSIRWKLGFRFKAYKIDPLPIETQIQYELLFSEDEQGDAHEEP